MTAQLEDAATQEDSASRGIRPNHWIIIFWAFFALVTVVSGIAASVFDFHHDSEITRKVFGNIPGPIKLLFYTVIPALLIYVGFQLSYRVKNWQRGGAEKRTTTSKNFKQRMEDMRAGLYMQTLMRDPVAGIMHSMIYFGFLILMAVTTTLEIDHQLPESLKFLHGGVYKGYALVGDAAGLIFIVGLLWAVLRRIGPRAMRPYRIRIKSKPEHAVILGTLLAIGISGYFAEAFRIAETGFPSFEKWSFIGYPLALAVDGLGNLAGWHQAWWIIHVLSFALFLLILPTTMLRHIVTSPANMYLKDRDRPKGAMKPMPNLMETELESFGVSTIEEFTWKQLMDTDACTMCGRCTAVCPAHATGKPLDPREIVLKTGEVMARSGTPAVTPPIGVDKEITAASEPGSILVAPNNVFDRITSEEIWACTSCKACDENCPVNIEILDKILDMRRYLSLMETAAIRSPPSTSTGSAALAASTTRTRRCHKRSASSCSAPTSASPSSAHLRCAPATPPDAAATNTSSRCSPCKTSRPSTQWASRRSLRSALTASTRLLTNTHNSVATTRSSTTASCSKS